MSTTGSKQRELAEVIRRFAAQLSPGEMRSAIRSVAPALLAVPDCIMCGKRLKLSCDDCPHTRAVPR